MSISSWLFGKKKSSPSTPPESENHRQSQIANGEEADEFVIIEKRRQTTIISGDYSNTMYPNLPYTLGPGPAQQPAYPQQQITRVESIDYEKNMLHDIPFKLSPELISADANLLRETSVRVNDILFKIKRLDKRHYDYDFNLENSVATD